MSEPDAAKIFKAGGKLIASPTGYDPDNNHGGTVLGAVTACALDAGIRYVPIEYDELGKAGDVLTFQDEPLFAVSFRSWDSDVLSRIFPSFSAGYVNLGGDPKFLADQAIPLLYAPDDPAAPGVYLLNAVPQIETMEMGLKLSILREFSIMCVFMGLPGSYSGYVTGRIGPTQTILGV